MMWTPVNKLNRSCSESELHKVNFDNLTIQETQDYSSVGFDKKKPFVTKRVVYVEEIFHDNSPRLLRSSSCSRVYGGSVPDQHHNLNSFFSTSLVLNNTFTESDISSLNLHADNPSLPIVSRNYIMNDGVVPMEVDILNDSLKIDDSVETMDMDTDTDIFTRRRFHKLDLALKKRYLTQKQPEITVESLGVANNTKIAPITLQRKRSQRNTFVLILLVCFLLILTYFLFFYGNVMIVMSVNSEIQLQNIKRDLLDKVHNQKISVNVVVKSLEQRERWARKIKVLGFIGSTGVGKTFVANTIKKHFHQGLVHELYGIHLSYTSQWQTILTTMKNCCFNLIIIDDLKRKDAIDVLALVHSLPQDQFILVISIFNIQYYDGKNYTINSNDIFEISNEFDNSDIYHELVRFQEFNINEVREWIEKQLKSKNLDNNVQKKILNGVLEGHNVKYHGLKRLYPKILLELEKYRQ